MDIQPPPANYVKAGDVDYIFRPVLMCSENVDRLNDAAHRSRVKRLRKTLAQLRDDEGQTPEERQVTALAVSRIVDEIAKPTLMTLIELKNAIRTDAEVQAECMCLMSDAIATVSDARSIQGRIDTFTLGATLLEASGLNELGKPSPGATPGPGKTAGSFVGPSGGNPSTGPQELDPANTED